MTRDEADILHQLSKDIGYIRGVIEPLVDARIPERLIAIEGMQGVLSERVELITTKREKTMAQAMIGTATACTVASAVAAIVTLFIH